MGIGHGGVVPMPIVLWGSLLYQRLISPRYRKVREAVGALSSRLENNIAGILVIKSFTAEKFESGLLLVIYYKSFALSGIILLGSFLSLIGVIVGHWAANLFTSETFFLTATSLIGFIALMGISSRNSLLLIDFAKSLMELHGMEKRRAIAVAAATRAKPIMLTAVAIILGSALLASDPVFGGLGVALISGTVAAVFVSLLFVPILMDNSKAMDFEPLEDGRHDSISITK